jgi:hypothetical protein
LQNPLEEEGGVEVGRDFQKPILTGPYSLGEEVQCSMYLLTTDICSFSIKLIDSKTNLNLLWWRFV